MSIALPVRGGCPAAKCGWVCLPKERPLSVLPGIVEFVTAPVTMLLRASFLKLEVQIFGDVLLDYEHGYPYFRAHDWSHDRPEHHHLTRDASSESGLKRHPMGEAEGRQR